MTQLADAIRLQAALHASQSGQARHALVVAIDPQNHAVKVSVMPEATVSGWIPDPGLACGSLLIACPAEIGTQVLVVPTEGDTEHPVIVARLFDATHRPPVSPASGHPVQPGEIGIFVGDGTYLHVRPGYVSMKGTLQVEGSVIATGAVRSGQIDLAAHVHRGVQAGAAATSAAVPGP